MGKIAIHSFVGHTTWTLDKNEIDATLLKSISSAGATTIYANPTQKPEIGQMYTVINNTAYDQSIKANSSSAGVTIKSGSKAEIYWDGYDFVNVEDTNTTLVKADVTNIKSAWQTWTPTLTWETGTPVNIITTAKYKIVGTLCFFAIYIKADNGNLATNVAITNLPAVPYNLICKPTFCSFMIGGANLTTRAAYLKDVAGTPTITYLSAHVIQFPINQPLEISMEGFYEIAS